ncbi:hypothetical protein FQN50_006053 [Emmonsiellopsis sp. PD_5]|nr:hypothetical protein FQN50_006053 [Emmonsiellopsis sp. PD_5]
MPPLPDFTDNPLQTRSDLLKAAVALLKPLKQYRSPANARIKIATDTAAGFDEVAAQLEGFARPLWAVASLLNDDEEREGEEIGLNSWIEGIIAGTDRNSSEYWGDVGDFDQRMVEMESIAYALLAAPGFFQARLRVNGGVWERVERWLDQINGRKMPQTNWLWFRVLVNLALGVTGDEDSVRGRIVRADLEMLDSFDIGEGWSGDGLWGGERKQADYYSGSFAIQFARLLYVKFMEERGWADRDKERIERFKSDARTFASGFWRFFDIDGAAIPFGRSQTYRFAFAAFWAAVAVTGLQLDAPLDNAGVIKGLLLRHLRWWAKFPGIFNTDGTLNIGYVYPNMYMSEDYNSPQSVYWCLKSFIVLSLAEKHTFWTSEELPHPLISLDISKGMKMNPQLDEVALLWAPRQILCNGHAHHFLLSSGQSTRKHHRAREAKYGKMAYSSAFAFSVPTGRHLEQLAPDSTLSVSLDDGERWDTRWEPFDVRPQSVLFVNSQGTKQGSVPALVSTWKPKGTVDHLRIVTMLIPSLKPWAGWHFRIHRVEWVPTALSQALQVADAGFAISGQTRKGMLLPQLHDGVADDESQLQNEGAVEGWYKNGEAENSSCLVLSNGGASGVFDLTPTMAVPSTHSTSSIGAKKMFQVTKSSATALRPDANTNLIAQRTLIPIVQHCLGQGSHGGRHGSGSGMESLFLATGIFAVAKSSHMDQSEIHRLRSRRPEVEVMPMAGEEFKVRLVLPEE